MTKIEQMNVTFLEAKGLSNAGASLAQQAHKVLQDIGEILGKLQAIQGSAETKAALNSMIGPEGVTYVAEVSAILYEARSKIVALEA